MRLTPGAEAAWMIAAGEAAVGGHPRIDPAHLLVGVLSLGGSAPGPRPPGSGERGPGPRGERAPPRGGRGGRPRRDPAEAARSRPAGAGPGTGSAVRPAVPVAHLQGRVRRGRVVRGLGPARRRRSPARRPRGGGGRRDVEVIRQGGGRPRSCAPPSSPRPLRKSPRLSPERTRRPTASPPRHPARRPSTASAAT